MVETQTEKQKREKIIKLVETINASTKRIQKNLYPLEFFDDGWRIVFDRQLENFDFLSSGRKLLEMAVYDLDMKGPYYWIPYSNPPRGTVTPALRLMRL